MDIGYNKLIEAIKNNELDLFLTSNPRYRIRARDGFDVMNDFFSVVFYLNEYGKTHLQFQSLLYDTIIAVLNENKLFYTYSIVKILQEQLELEYRGKAAIHFIDDTILAIIRQQIISNKEQLCQRTKYDGSLYPNGILGVYESIDEELYILLGKHILFTCN